MRVIKKINNNVAICIDSHQRELVAFGKGIGFPQMPYELNDLSLISQTFYNVDNQYYALFNDINEEIFRVSIKIIDYAKAKLDCDFNPNLLFILADHINFAIERFKKGINVNMPISDDIRQLYPQETAVGSMGRKLVNQEFQVALPRIEEVSIAMHFINNTTKRMNDIYFNDEGIINTITDMIELDCGIKIDRENFNYSRFVSHMHYLFRRKTENQCIVSQNSILFDKVKSEYPESYRCVLKIKEYFKTVLDWKPSDEELLYLLLHINRLCAREDCNH